MGDFEKSLKPIKNLAKLENVKGFDLWKYALENHFNCHRKSQEILSKKVVIKSTDGSDKVYVNDVEIDGVDAEQFLAEERLMKNEIVLNVSPKWAQQLLLIPRFHEMWEHVKVSVCGEASTKLMAITKQLHSVRWMSTMDQLLTHFRSLVTS